MLWKNARTKAVKTGTAGKDKGKGAKAVVQVTDKALAVAHPNMVRIVSKVVAVVHARPPDIVTSRRTILTQTTSGGSGSLKDSQRVPADGVGSVSASYHTARREGSRGGSEMQMPCSSGGLGRGWWVAVLAVMVVLACLLCCLRSDASGVAPRTLPAAANPLSNFILRKFPMEAECNPGLLGTKGAECNPGLLGTKGTPHRKADRPQPDILVGMVDCDVTRDVVEEALGKNSPSGEVWDRQTFNAEEVGLRPMQVRGNTAERPRFTFQDLYSGMGGATIALTEAGGRCVGATDECESLAAVFEANTGITPSVKTITGTTEDAMDADVLFASPPVKTAVRGKGGKCKRKVALTAFSDILNVIGRATTKYKVVCLETLPWVGSWDNGAALIQLCSSLECLGYQVSSKELFAPDFGSSCARRIRYVVGIENSIAEVTGAFDFPLPNTKHHPLHTILDPPIKRDGAYAYGLKLRRRVMPALSGTAVNQQPSLSLRPIGRVNWGGEGERVYSIDGLAATQKVSGKGPGWTSGLYEYDGRITRLTLREVARLQGFEDDVALTDDEVESRAMLARASSLGAVRAIGLGLGRALHLAGKAAVGPSLRTPPAEIQQQGDIEAHWRALGHTRSRALHQLRMIAWQASDAAKAAADKVMQFDEVAVRKTVTKLGELGYDAQEVLLLECAHTLARHSVMERMRLRAAVEFLQWSYWLKMQRRKGLEAVLTIAADGASYSDFRQALKSVARTMDSELSRGKGSSGPVELLWWGWPKHMWTELRDGYRLPWDELPKEFRGDNYESAVGCPKVLAEFERLESLGYISGPYEEDEVMVINPLSSVPKKGTDKIRVVVDITASGVNPAMTAPRFVLPMVEDVAADSYEGCFYIITDLSDGFFCQRVHEDDQVYLALRHPGTGKVWVYNRMPFGLVVSPWNFSRKVAIMVQEMLANYPEFKAVRTVVNDEDPHMPRTYGVNAQGRPVCSLKFYVDDGAIAGPTREATLQGYKRLVWFQESVLGLRVNRRKTIGPAHRVPFLGLELDSVGGEVGEPCTRLPQKRRERCLNIVTEMLGDTTTRGRVGRRQLASVVGELMFASRAVGAGKTFLQRMYACLSEQGSSAKGVAHDYDRSVPMTKGARLDLRWWKRCLEVCECVVKWKTRTFALHRIWTDASSHGYCDTMEVAARTVNTVRGVAAPGGGASLPAMSFGYGVWDKVQAKFSSNWHELATIVMSVAQHLEVLRGSTVHYLTDNTCACASVNKGTVHSPQLMQLVRELRLLQAEGDIDIEAFHASGKVIVDQGTDGGSRQMPHLNQLSANPLPHDTFDPTAWPAFDLGKGVEVDLAKRYLDASDKDMSVVEHWHLHDVAGMDTFWHLRPRHVHKALQQLLEAQLRQPETTAFTVVVPLVNMRTWRKYVKHFRRKRVFDVMVEGLAAPVKHILLRCEAGDSLRGKAPLLEEELWADSGGWSCPSLRAAAVNGLDQPGVEMGMAYLDLALPVCDRPSATN